jgi:peptidyl-prolyl cis-trans isomerase D
MLKLMRNSFQQLKWILVAVIAVFVLFIFVDWGAGGAGQGGRVDAYAARVNRETIPLNEYGRTVGLLQRQYQQMYGDRMTPEMLEALGLERQAIDALIDQKLLLQEAERLHLTATPEEIRKAVLEIPTLNPGGKFVGAELYERYVTGNLGYPTPAAFEEELARSLTLSKMNSAIASGILIPPGLAEQEYRRRTESAKIRYILNPVDEAGVIVAPQDVDQYYKNNSSRYQNPEQRRVKYLLANAATLQVQIQPSDSELRAMYEGAKESYKVPEMVHAQHILIRSAQGATPAEDLAAKAKADSVLAQIRGGAAFGDMARKFSDDPGSKETGGDLGFFGAGQMVPEFERAAFSLEPGQVSDIVKSQFGYHIVKTIEKRPSSYRPFEDVREELRATATSEKAKAQARERLLQVKSRLDQAKPKSEADVRRQADDIVSFNDSTWFGRNEPVPGLDRVPALNEWAFSAKVGDVGTVIDTAAGPLLPYLVAERPAGVKPIAEIRPQVERDAKLAKGREQARSELAASLKGAPSLDAVAAKLGLTPAETSVQAQGFVSGFSGDIRALVAEAMAAPLKQTRGPVVVDQGAVAFEVVQQVRFDKAAFEKEKPALIEQIRRQESDAARTSLVAKLRKDSDIVVSQELLKPARTQGQPGV